PRIGSKDFSVREPVPNPSIYIWDVATGKPAAITDTEAALAPTNRLAFSPDGKRLMSCGHPLLSWRLGQPSASRRPLATIDGSRVEHVLRARYADGDGGDALVIVHDWVSPLGPAVISRDGRWLAGTAEVHHTKGAPAKDHMVAVWEIASGGLVWCAAGHRGKIRTLDFSPDARTLVSGGIDTTIILWDLSAGDGPAALPKRFSAKELDELWRHLAGDAATAYRASWKLAARPDQALALLA